MAALPNKTPVLPVIVKLLVLALVITGCSPKPKLQPLASDDVILAFGDSLTAGVGTSKEHSYPAVLANLTGRSVINAGVSGETTAQGLQRLTTVLEHATAKLIILIEGGNDILRSQNLSQSKQNLAQMIEVAQSHGLDVVLIGVPEKKLFSNAAPMYAELAEQYNLVFDDKLIATLIRQAQYKSDSVHFNQAGYKAMAQEIHALLEEHGAL